MQMPKIYTSKEEALELLKAQLISPVLYKQSIKACENEVDYFIEFGASVLKGLNKNHFKRNLCFNKYE